MSGNTRTMAFQIPEELFQRIKTHLERETRRTGRKLTQREFVLGLIEEALNEAERLAAEEAGENGSVEASVGPCEAAEPEDEAPSPRRSPDAPQRPPDGPCEAPGDPAGSPGAFFIPSRASQTLKFSWR